MKLTKTNIAIVIALFLIPCLSWGQAKYSKVKIPVSSAQQRKYLFDNLELDHFSQEGNSLEVVLSERELLFLQNASINYQVIVDDVVKHTIEVNSMEVPTEAGRAAFEQSCKTVGSIITTPSAFGTGGSLRLGAAAGNPGYFTYAEMQTKMTSLASAYSSIVTLFSIGNSYEGTPIYGVKISDNVSTDEGEAEVLFTGLQHAREAIGGTSLIFFMQYLAENYGSNARVRELVDSREMYIFPCLNPDGYKYNYTAPNPTSGGGLWRKSRRPTTGGNFGVDLNRNYGIDWGNCTGASTSCGSSSASLDTYYGPSAFSEPETQAIRDFVYGRNVIAAIDQHCFGPYYSLPYGRPTLHPALNTEDQRFYTHIPALMGLYNGHRAGNSPQTVNYEVAGGIKDWLLMGDIGTGTKGKIYGMTGEAGGGDFWAPVSQIPQLCKELCFQDIQLALAAGAYYDIEDASDLALPAIPTGNLNFTIRRIGLTNAPVTVTLVPMENIYATEPPVTISSMPVYYDSYTGSATYALPSGIVAGQRIRFAWKVQSDGITIFDTVVKFYNPTIVMSDDMEGSFSTKWNSSTGWDFTNGYAYGGSQSMTESKTGNYTSNSTRTATYNTNFSLSGATSAYLSFWVRHRAENFRDKLQVQVSSNSTNGTNGTWTPICGRNTVQESNTTNSGSLGGLPALTGIRESWTRELYDLGNYLGQTNVRFRFQFTSDNDASAFAYELDDGFYIDNVQLARSNAAIVLLPVKFISVKGLLQPDHTISIQWEAIVDNEHDHFIVEKSIDGKNFARIGNPVYSQPYETKDMHAVSGNNYYRVKQVDKNGDVSYSYIINVSVPVKVDIDIYPNPVENILSIKLNKKQSGLLKLELLDLAGRLVSSKYYSADQNTTVLKLNTSMLESQVYILKITNSQGLVVKTERIVKVD